MGASGHIPGLHVPGTTIPLNPAEQMHHRFEAERQAADAAARVRRRRARLLLLLSD